MTTPLATQHDNPDLARWEAFVASLPAPETIPAAQFQAAVLTVAERAFAALPHSCDRLQRAVRLVLDGEVSLLPDGCSARVNSQSVPGKYWVVNGECPCPDAQHRALGGFCKHRLAYGIMKRASSLAAEALDTTPPAPPSPFDGPTHLVPGIPAHCILVLHGKPFVTYAGLLGLAHERGLTGLTARFISVTPELALAEATATFADGRVFTEAADSTPDNVGSTVRPHFARVSLARAKARALRDALNISMIAVEELE